MKISNRIFYLLISLSLSIAIIVLAATIYLDEISIIGYIFGPIFICFAIAKFILSFFENETVQSANEYMQTISIGLEFIFVVLSVILLLSASDAILMILFILFNSMATTAVKNECEVEKQECLDENYNSEDKGTIALKRQIEDLKEQIKMKSLQDEIDSLKKQLTKNKKTDE